MPRTRLTPPAAPSGPAVGRLMGLVVVLAVFFALPAALFVRFVGSEGSVNPDLIPDRPTLRRVTPAEWASLAVAVTLIAAAAWWVATASR